MVNISNGLVQFNFYRPQAETVEIIGDFNNWRPGQLKMIPQPNGYWTATLKLPPGNYKFRYRADGQWFTDYAAFGLEPGPTGWDSVVRVAPPRQQARRMTATSVQFPSPLTPELSGSVA